VLLVSGFGAHRTLMREAGLHVFEQPGAKGNTVRLAVRVLVVPSPAGQLSDSERQASIAEALAQLTRTSTVVRRYRRNPSPLVRDREWRSGKIDAVLGGDFDVIEKSAG
jgi:ATP-dependent Clp protease ATP-binding subunit ClpC